MRVAMTGWVCVLAGVMVLNGCDNSASPPPAATTVTETTPEPAPAETTVATPEAAAPEAPAAPAPEALATYESLEPLMKDIGRSFQFLRRNMDQPDNDAALLERVAKMRALVALAKTMTPKHVEQAAEADRATLMAMFDDHLSQLPPLLDEMETAIKAGDRAAAKAALGKLHDAEEAGHEALGVKD